MFSALEAFLLHLLAGVTFEFFDDIACWGAASLLGGDLDRCRTFMVTWANEAAGAAPFSAFFGTLIGYAASPLSVVVIWFVGKAKSAGDAFWRAITIELTEGVIAVIGQIITDQNFSIAIWSLGLSAVIEPVRGGIASVTYAWNTSGIFRFTLILIGVGLFAFGLNVVGLLPI